MNLLKPWRSDASNGGSTKFGGGNAADHHGLRTSATPITTATSMSSPSPSPQHAKESPSATSASGFYFNDGATVDSWGVGTVITSSHNTLQPHPTQPNTWQCPTHMSYTTKDPLDGCPHCERQQRHALQERRQSVERQLRDIHIVPDNGQQQHAMVSSNASVNTQTHNLAAKDILQDLHSTVQQWKSQQQQQQQAAAAAAVSSSTGPPPAPPPPILIPPSMPPSNGNNGGANALTSPAGTSALANHPLEALAMQIQGMQRMQDWMLYQKEQECQTLRQKLEQSTQQINQLAVENALLQEKLNQQEQRMKHELKLIKLAALQRSKASNSSGNSNKLTNGSSSTTNSGILSIPPDSPNPHGSTASSGFPNGNNVLSPSFPNQPSQSTSLPTDTFFPSDPLAWGSLTGASNTNARSLNHPPPPPPALEQSKPLTSPTGLNPSLTVSALGGENESRALKHKESFASTTITSNTLASHLLQPSAIASATSINNDHFSTTDSVRSGSQSTMMGTKLLGSSSLAAGSVSSMPDDNARIPGSGGGGSVASLESYQSGKSRRSAKSQRSATSQSTPSRIRARSSNQSTGGGSSTNGYPKPLGANGTNGGPLQTPQQPPPQSQLHGGQVMTPNSLSLSPESHEGDFFPVNDRTPHIATPGVVNSSVSQTGESKPIPDDSLDEIPSFYKGGPVDIDDLTDLLKRKPRLDTVESQQQSQQPQTTQQQLQQPQTTQQPQSLRPSGSASQDGDDFSYGHVPRDIQIDPTLSLSGATATSASSALLLQQQQHKATNKAIPTLPPPPEHKTSAMIAKAVKKVSAMSDNNSAPEQMDSEFWPMGSPAPTNTNTMDDYSVSTGYVSHTQEPPQQQPIHQQPPLPPAQQPLPPPQKEMPPPTTPGPVLVNFPDSDTASVGNTVASSTYGEDRQQVTQQVILDPYGDKGTYTGIILRSTGMPHGSGRMIYQEDNRTYDGEWRHGRWHGYGRATFANGDNYQGEYRFDQRHGRGRYEWSDGRVYDGMFKEDKRHGRGIFTWPDGAVYDGMFRNGQREGHGIYRFSDGGRYEGSWRDGRYNGFGICNWEDGRCYKGEWLNGMAHGKGVETFADGTVRHDGQWIEDEPVMA